MGSPGPECGAHRIHGLEWFDASAMPPTPDGGTSDGDVSKRHGPGMIRISAAGLRCVTAAVTASGALAEDATVLVVQAIRTLAPRSGCATPKMRRRTRVRPAARL